MVKLAKKKKEKNLKTTPPKMPKVLETVKFQKGKTHMKIDKIKEAMPPGKRLSKKGNIYYEYRKNRTDLKKNI